VRRASWWLGEPLASLPDLTQPELIAAAMASRRQWQVTDWEEEEERRKKNKRKREKRKTDRFDSRVFLGTKK